MSCPSGKLAQFDAKGNPPQNPTPKCVNVLRARGEGVLTPVLAIQVLGERLSARRESGAIRTGGRLGDSSGHVYVHMDETHLNSYETPGFPELQFDEG
jgi:hypothetical protein